jgi:hypothetical protein
MIAPVVQPPPVHPPRFFARMAPGWALYAFAVLALAALTGLIGWLAQRGIRLIWSILVALGLGAHLAAFTLLWQRAAWRTRVHRAGALAAPPLRPALARVEQRAQRTAQGFLLAGLILFAAGMMGIFCTRGKPTME